MYWFGPGLASEVNRVRRRAVLGAVVGTLWVAGLPASAAEVPRWSWQLHSAGAPCPVGSSCAAAGKFGTFLFVLAGQKGGAGPIDEEKEHRAPLAVQAEGEEAPLPYPEPLYLPKVTSPGKALTTVGGWRPCNNAACFSGLPPIGTRRWVAVVDWGNWHGWSVGWLIKKYSAANIPVVLYRLDHPDVVRFAGPEISDLHVIAALSRVAEDLRLPGVLPPLAVNLSFGRRAGPTDPAVLGSCEPSTLPCQVSRLMDFLREVPGPGIPEVEVVAAAGNYKSLLFPANDRTATTAGSLDLAQFAAKGAIQPTWETTGRFDVATVLLPTAGLTLQEAGDRFQPPAGASYAAALLSGWLSRPAVGGPSPWVGSAVPGGAITLDPAVATDFRPLYEPWPQLPPALPLEPEVLASVGANWSQALPPSLSQMVATEHRPAPEPNPCVPCIDTRPPPDTDPPLSFGAASLQGNRSDDLDLVLDLTASHPLPAGVEVQHVLLRTTAGLHTLVVAGPDLEALAAGTVAGLRVVNGRALVADGAFPSLVFIMAYSSGPFAASPHWVATPIVTRGDP